VDTEEGSSIMYVGVDYRTCLEGSPLDNRISYCR